jgi:hypothetical protein
MKKNAKKNPEQEKTNREKHAQQMNIILERLKSAIK